MCDSDTLHRSIITLQGDLRINTEAQQETQKAQAETQKELTEVSSTFKTWQRTRCDDHHTAIAELRKDSASQRASMANSSGKQTAIVGGIMVAIQIVAVVVAAKVL